MSKVCVVGAGVMGWSIAQVFSEAGYEVVLCDRELALAQKGKDSLAKSLARLTQKGKMDEAQAAGILARVNPGEYEAAQSCGLMVEAIFENLEVKKELLKRMDAILPETAIMASNTSSLSITEMSMVLKNPSRFVGMHFFNPAAVMKLVEVIGGAYTHPDVLAKTIEIAEQIGKTPVKVQESPGFVVNRILIPMINEAVFALAEGVASAEDIDTAMKLGANHPMGPLALGDLIGIDVCLAIMEVMQRETGDDRYRPHPLMRKMVRANKLGRKSGEGFFSYTDSAAKR